VCGLDVQSLAIARACSAATRDANGCVVLNLGWTFADVTVVRDGYIVYERTLSDLGLDRLDDSLNTKLGLDREVSDYILRRLGYNDEDVDDGRLGPVQLREVRGHLLDYLKKLGAELRTSIDYISREHFTTNVTHLLLVGEGASTPGLAASLANNLDLEVEPLSPGSIMTIPASLRSRASSALLTVALGLAMYPGRSAA
jgi:Tfp pilus assembly PilM family ATPase